VRRPCPTFLLQNHGNAADCALPQCPAVKRQSDHADLGQGAKRKRQKRGHTKRAAGGEVDGSSHQQASGGAHGGGGYNPHMFDFKRGNNGWPTNYPADTGRDEIAESLHWFFPLNPDGSIAWPANGADALVAFGFAPSPREHTQSRDDKHEGGDLLDDTPLSVDNEDMGERGGGNTADGRGAGLYGRGSSTTGQPATHRSKQAFRPKGGKKEEPIASSSSLHGKTPKAKWQQLPQGVVGKPHAPKQKGGKAGSHVRFISRRFQLLSHDSAGKPRGSGLCPHK
jgi:hypothetical protein